MPDSCISQTTSIFQAHPIKVLTDRLLRQVLSIPDASGRLIKWSIELGQFDITYHPRTSIKGQALVDFLIEGKISKEDPLVKNDTETWKLYVDEASNENGSGAGLIMMSPDNFKFHYALTILSIFLKHQVLIKLVLIVDQLRLLWDVPGK